MVGGNWLDPDGRFRQFGTSKATPETGGDYKQYGQTRQLEYTIDLTTLTPFGTNIIFGNTVQIPKGVYVESVEIDVEVAAVGAGATLSVGLIGHDRATVDSATGFVAVTMTTALLAQGAKLSLVPGSTGVGTYVGTTTGTPVTGYLIAQSGTAVFSAGKIKLRINYRTTSNITQ